MHNQTKAWRERVAEHGPVRIPADEVRDHILKLKAEGMSMKAVGRAAGIAPETPLRIARGQRTVLEETAQAILAVTGTSAPHGYVSASHSATLIKRMRATLTFQQIGSAAGLSGWTIGSIAAGKQKHVCAETASAIERVARQHGLIRSCSPAIYRIDVDALEAECANAGHDLMAVLEAAGITQDIWGQIRRGRLVSEDRAEQIARSAGVSPARIAAQVEEVAA